MNIPETPCPECERVMELKADGFHCPGCRLFVKMPKKSVEYLRNQQAYSQMIDAYSEALQAAVVQISAKKKCGQ